MAGAAIGAAGGGVGGVSPYVSIFASALSIANSVWGLVRGATGSGSFAASQQGMTAVRVHVGNAMNLPDNHWFGGDRPGVTLFDDYGQYIGKANGNARNKHKIKPGEYHDILVPHRKQIGNVRPDYISITHGGGVDAICIAAIAVTFPDGAKHIMYGDNFAGCNNISKPEFPIDWSYSKKRVGDDLIVPLCIWIDGDNTNGNDGFLRSPEGISWNVQSFQFNEARIKAYNDNPKLRCKAPRLQTWNDMRTERAIDVYIPPLVFWPNGTDQEPNRILFPKGQYGPSQTAKRSVETEEGYYDYQNLTTTYTRPRRAKRAFADDHVVISKEEQHSAVVLCKDPYSRMASLVSLSEQTFCDMSTRHTYPLCDAEKGIDAPCYDFEKHTMRYLAVNSTSEAANFGMHMAVAMRPDTVFSRIERWDLDDGEAVAV